MSCLRRDRSRSGYLHIAGRQPETSEGLGVEVDKSGQMIACVLLAIAFTSSAWSAENPVPLNLEGTTTLHVGELAVLKLPPGNRYAHFEGKTGAGNVLVLVRRLRDAADF
jgi:hypothetical protein